MFVISSWDENAEITYINSERYLQGGDEAEALTLRPVLPAEENEFLSFGAAKLELLARLEQKVVLLQQRIEALHNTNEASTRARTEHANFVRTNASRVGSPMRPTRMTEGPDFELDDDDLGPQGETL